MDTPAPFFVAALGQLRHCGFFEAYAGQTDAQAAASLLADLRQRSEADLWRRENPAYGYDQNLLRQFAEPATATSYKDLAAHDPARVWRGDLEADVCADNRVYEQLVAEYARLSMGTLQPTDITETWQSEEGPVTISFTSRGRQFSTELACYDDWIDGDVFGFLDEAMRSQGFTAAVYAEVNTGQDVFFVRATEDEKACMEQQLGWSFDWQALVGDLDEQAPG